MATEREDELEAERTRIERNDTEMRLDEVGETPGETNVGLDENAAGALAYVLGFVTGAILYFVEDDNEFVRFHAAQSIVVFGGVFLLNIAVSFVPGFLLAGNSLAGLVVSLVFGLLSLLVGLGALVLWIFLIVKAYRGQTPRIPVAAGIADGMV